MVNPKTVFQKLAPLSFICALVLIAWGGRGFAQMVTENTAPPDRVTTTGMPMAQTRGTGDREAWEWDVVRLVNQERANNGDLPPLKRDDALDAAAYGHSRDMGVNNFFSHTGSNGSTPWDRMRAAGYQYSYAGENIAAGYGSPPSVMQGWMNSSGHRGNILNSNFREIGVGYYYDNDGSGYGHYWTQNFGRRSAIYPVVINREAYSTTTPILNLYVYGPRDAQQMRFKNAGGNWSAWQPYTADTIWSLADGGSGIRTVYAQVSDDAQIFEANDDIHYLPSEPFLNVSPPMIVFLAQQGTTTCIPASYTVHVSNVGGGTLHWSATEASSWLDITETGNTLEVTCDGSAVGTLSLGAQHTEVTITSDGVANSPQIVSVTLIVAQKIHSLYEPIITRAH